jgi:hypothetical protein
MSVVSKAAVTGKEPTPLSMALGEIDSLFKADDYAGVAAVCARTVADHPQVKYMVEEALPSRVYDHVLARTGEAAALVTYTLKNPTWTVDLQRVATDPAAFAAMATAIEEKVRAIAESRRKPH